MDLYLLHIYTLYVDTNIGANVSWMKMSEVWKEMPSPF